MPDRPFILSFSGKQINGETHAEYVPRVLDLFGQNGFEVVLKRDMIKQPMPALGLTDFQKREVVLSTVVPGNMRLRVALHELGHVLTGLPILVWADLDGYHQHVRAEVVAESVALRVCNGLGLDILDVSTHYIGRFHPSAVREALELEQHRIHYFADNILEKIR